MNKQPEKEIELARAELKQYWPTFTDVVENQTTSSVDRTLANRSPLAYRIMMMTKELVRFQRVEWSGYVKPLKVQAMCQTIGDSIFDGMLEAMKNVG